MTRHGDSQGVYNVTHFDPARLAVTVHRFFERREIIGFGRCEDFAQLGKFLSEPVKTYSAGMRSRLNFGLSLAIDFDCFLIDEVVAAGDQRFQRRAQEELFEKRANGSLILASHVPDIIRAHCSRAVVLHRGRAKEFEDLELALAIYNDL